MSVSRTHQRASIREISARRARELGGDLNQPVLPRRWDVPTACTKVFVVRLTASYTYLR